VQQAEIYTDLLGNMPERGHILGKARTSVTDARAQKLRSNTRIQAHAFCDFFYVGSSRFADIRNDIDEGYLCCQKGIRCVFDNLSGLR